MSAVILNIIWQFKDEYRFLSNMWRLESPYVVEGGSLPTAEHIYMYAKSEDPKWREFVLREKNPYEVRKKSRDKKFCKLRKDWDSIKDYVMEEAIHYKFSNHNAGLLEKLLETGYTTLVEGNYHNDDYWGFDLKKGSGENNLGRLIMARRLEFLEQGDE